MGDKKTGEVPDALRMPLAEEHLVAEVTEREQGVVRLTKRVEIIPTEAVFDLRSDDVSIQRRARNEVVQEVQAPFYEGDTMVIPVYEEQVFVETRLVLIEEILISTGTKTEQVTVKENLRREVVDITNDDST